jgi:nitrous oxidase accessory protein
LVDQLVWKFPTAKLLLGSPAMQLLRWAQSEFPALHPGGVRDSVPLMAPAEASNADVSKVSIVPIVSKRE